MEEIVGHIERITFHNEENGFTVAHLQEAGRSETTCVVGCMPSIQAGETVRCFGIWKQHLVHGRQFEMKNYRVEAPADIIGIKKYLGSGLVKGIGPGYAGKIVDAFGPLTLDVIDKNPDRLLEVPGLGRKRLDKIKECWNDQKAIREVMVFLQTYGVTPSYAQKIFKFYGSQAVQKVKENPYQLANDISGIGFKSADTIASKLGIPKDSPQRIDSGIEYVLSQFTQDGHVCYPLDELMQESAKTLETVPEICSTRLQTLQEQERVEIGDLIIEGFAKKFVWIKSLFKCEMGIAKELKRLYRAPCAIRKVDTLKAVDWVQGQLGIKLAENQCKAVGTAMLEKLLIITGGPGTGKSTITNAILHITAKLTEKIILAAPTGRAAKRMSEITGRKASTIHSLLEYNFKTRSFKRNRECPLDCDLIIVDESSMIDTLLMFSLLKAIPDNARVILVGDINQLPSVGPGNVLKDIIISKCLPVIILNEIFRQAAGSKIVVNAHHINSGRMPDTKNLAESDFFFMQAETPEEVLDNIVSLVTQRLPRKYGFNPLEEIQVLAPMKRGIIGTENLNAILQKALNPKDNFLIKSGRQFLVGDKVMQIKNNYEKNIFNGDIGYITKINTIDQQLAIEIEDREIIYDFSELEELVLAYAVSVHKYQGSECPCVVLPIHTTHFVLLHRNLLYTGVTRGKKLVVLVGTKKALAIAVKNDEVLKRHTGLEQVLVGQLPLTSSRL